MKAENTQEPLIKLAHPTIPESAIQRAVEVLRSGSLVQGKWVGQLERDICSLIGCEYAVVVSSGTAALHLALLASNIGPGDEVIVPAFTFPATANAVVLTGARPVLVDISLEDFNIDPARIESAITHRTRAVIPVHEFGLPANMTAINEIATRHNLTVIEDAACTLGAMRDGVYIGTGKNAVCFSFHPRKAITTGEGGVIVTENQSVADRLRSLRNHGIVSRDGELDIYEAAPNYRMTDFQAALAIEQLQTLDAQIMLREQQATRYAELLGNIADLHLPAAPGSYRHVYQTFHVLLDPAIDRDALIGELRKKGVETNFGAWALNRLTLYRRQYGHSNDDCPNAVRAFHSGLALPIGSHLSDNDLRRVCSRLTECLETAATAV